MKYFEELLESYQLLKKRQFKVDLRVLQEQGAAAQQAGGAEATAASYVSQAVGLEKDQGITVTSPTNNNTYLIWQAKTAERMIVIEGEGFGGAGSPKRIGDAKGNPLTGEHYWEKFVSMMGGEEAAAPAEGEAVEGEAVEGEAAEGVPEMPPPEEMGPPIPALQATNPEAWKNLATINTRLEKDKEKGSTAMSKCIADAEEAIRKYDAEQAAGAAEGERPLPCKVPGWVTGGHQPVLPVPGSMSEFGAPGSLHSTIAQGRGFKIVNGVTADGVAYTKLEERAVSMEDQTAAAESAKVISDMATDGVPNREKLEDLKRRFAFTGTGCPDGVGCRMVLRDPNDPTVGMVLPSSSYLTFLAADAMRQAGETATEEEWGADDDAFRFETIRSSSPDNPQKLNDFRGKTMELGPVLFSMLAVHNSAMAMGDVELAGRSESHIKEILGTIQEDELLLDAAFSYSTLMDNGEIGVPIDSLEEIQLAEAIVAMGGHQGVLRRLAHTHREAVLVRKPEIVLPVGKRVGLGFATDTVEAFVGPDAEVKALEALRRQGYEDTDTLVSELKVGSIADLMAQNPEMSQRYMDLHGLLPEDTVAFYEVSQKAYIQDGQTKSGESRPDNVSNLLLGNGGDDVHPEFLGRIMSTLGIRNPNAIRRFAQEDLDQNERIDSLLPDPPNGRRSAEALTSMIQTSLTQDSNYDEQLVEPLLQQIKSADLGDRRAVRQLRTTIKRRLASAKMNQRIVSGDPDAIDYANSRALAIGGTGSPTMLTIAHLESGKQFNLDQNEVIAEAGRGVHDGTWSIEATTTGYRYINKADASRTVKIDDEEESRGDESSAEGKHYKVRSVARISETQSKAHDRDPIAETGVQQLAASRDLLLQLMGNQQRILEGILDAISRPASKNRQSLKD